MWVTVRAGEYIVGDDRWPDSGRHRFRLLRSLAVVCLPVTLGEFIAFVDSQAYWDDRWWTWGPIGREAGADAIYRRLGYGPDRWGEPVRVSFFEASAFARSRDARLLREKEWEVAAAGWLQPKSVPGLEELQAAIAGRYPGPYAPHLTPEDFSTWGGVFGLCPEWCADGYDPMAYRLYRSGVDRGDPAPLRLSAAHRPLRKVPDRQCYRGAGRSLMALDPSWVTRRMSMPATTTGRIGFRLCWDL